MARGLIFAQRAAMMVCSSLHWIHNTQTSKASRQFQKISFKVVDSCPSCKGREKIKSDGFFKWFE